MVKVIAWWTVVCSVTCVFAEGVSRVSPGLQQFGGLGGGGGLTGGGGTSTTQAPGFIPMTELRPVTISFIVVEWTADKPLWLFPDRLIPDKTLPKLSELWSKPADLVGYLKRDLPGAEVSVKMCGAVSLFVAGEEARIRSGADVLIGSVYRSLGTTLKIRAWPVEDKAHLWLRVEYEECVPQESEGGPQRGKPVRGFKTRTLKDEVVTTQPSLFAVGGLTERVEGSGKKPRYQSQIILMRPIEHRH